MDLSGYWQENKRFVASVAAGGLVFLLGWFAIDSTYGGEIAASRNEIRTRTRELAKASFSSQDLADARAENERLQQAVERLRAVVAFRPRAGFALDPAQGSASTQYLRALARVRDELLPRANRANLELDSGLGMPALSPTREDEILRTLEALDLVASVVDDAIAARLSRVERIQLRLDPGLSSREGLGTIERTRVAFTLSGSALAVERLLARTQRPPDGRVLHVDSAEVQPSRAKPGEVRLELTLSLVRLAEAAPAAGKEP